MIDPQIIIDAQVTMKDNLETESSGTERDNVELQVTKLTFTVFWIVYLKGLVRACLLIA